MVRGRLNDQRVRLGPPDDRPASLPGQLTERIAVEIRKIDRLRELHEREVRRQRVAHADTQLPTDQDHE